MKSAIVKYTHILLIIPLLLCVSCNREDEFSDYSYEYQPFPADGVRYEFEYAIDFYDHTDTLIRAIDLSHTYSIWVPPRAYNEQSHKSDYIFWFTEIDNEAIQRDTIYTIYGFRDIQFQTIPGETFIRLDLTPTTGQKYGLFFDQNNYDPSRFFQYDFPFTIYNGKLVCNYFKATE